jgi:hypothetical protein
MSGGASTIGGMGHAISSVESDCLNLINDIQRKTSSRSCLMGILSEIQVVKKLLQECHFIHIKRVRMRLHTS